MDKLFDLKTLIHVAIESLAIGLLAIWFNNKIKKLNEKVEELEKVCAEHRNAISGILQHLNGGKGGGGGKGSNAGDRKGKKKVPIQEEDEERSPVNFEESEDELLSRELDDIKKNRSSRSDSEGDIESEEGYASGTFNSSDEESGRRLKKSEADL